MDLVEIPGVEVFEVGTWNGDTYTGADLDEMVSAFKELGSLLKPPVKLGHGSQELLERSGYPSAGWIKNLYRRGKKLFADLTDVPAKVAELIKNKAYRTRSAEIYWGFQEPSTKKTFPKVFKALALLGEEIPAVSTIDDILAWYQVEGLESNVKVYLSSSEPTKPEPAPSPLNRSYAQKEKSSVSFREADEYARSCGACRFGTGGYEMNGMMSCSLVEGTMAEGMTCDLQEMKSMKMMPKKGDMPPDMKGGMKGGMPASMKREEKEMDPKELDKKLADAAEEGRKKGAAEAEARYKQEAEEKEKKYKEERDVQAARLLALEEKSKHDETVRVVEGFIEDQRLIPAQKDLAVFLLESAGNGEKTYDKGGKKLSYAEALKSLFASAPKMSIYAELSIDDEKKDGEGETSKREGLAGECDNLVKEYLDKHTDEGEADALAHIEGNHPKGKLLVEAYFSRTMAKK